MKPILAIDPGTEQSAYVLRIGDHLQMKGIISNQKMVNLIYAGSGFDVVIEMIASYGMPVGKTTFETVLWIGRFIEASKQSKKDVYKMYRKDVKMHLCQSMKAKDSNIRQSLIDKFGEKGTKKEPNEFYNDAEIKMNKDIWSALAICTTYFENPKLAHLC